MRVWVVDSAEEQFPENVVALLRELGTDLITELRLVKVSPYRADLAETLRRLSSHPPDVVVIDARTCPADSSLREVLNLDVGAILVSPAECIRGLHALAEEYPVVFASPESGVEGLRLALVSAHTAGRRQSHWRARVADLEQRLKDRIVIERAKGILIQQLGITEEESYRRLRLLARRQQKPIRAVAQSVLEMHALLSSDGAAASTAEERTSIAPVSDRTLAPHASLKMASRRRE